MVNDAAVAVTGSYYLYQLIINCLQRVHAYKQKQTHHVDNNLIINIHKL